VFTILKKDTTVATELSCSLGYMAQERIKGFNGTA